MTSSTPGRWECAVCGYVYDETTEGTGFKQLPDDWECPICGAAGSEFVAEQAAAASPTGASAAGEATPAGPSEYLAQWARRGDELEEHMADIHEMAETATSIVEPMRTRKPTPMWDQLLIKGAQLATLPLNEDEPVNTRTVIGPRAQHPLAIDTPLFVTHMSYGALSKEAKVALARGGAAVRTAMCSGEGGLLGASHQEAHRYILEYVPNQYSITDENLRQVDAIEIKIGQSAKPGMGGHLPAGKVTAEVAAVRGRPEGQAITSPARFADIGSGEQLKAKVAELRQRSGGRPIGVKLAAGHVEADLGVALAADPDFVTLDGRPGATAAAPKFVKQAASIPTVYALFRARQFLTAQDADHVSLIITGGLRVSADFAKALALGADAVALGTAALMAIGCQQYRICHTGKCPVGITTQDPELRARLDVDQSAQRLANFLRVSTEELRMFARLTGHDDVHGLSVADLCTTSSELSRHTDVAHV